jgi:outer membrane protein assembly factor BamB
VKAPGDDGSKPRVEYTLTDEVPYVPTPLAYRGRLFTWSDGGVITCHDAATGRPVWLGRVKGGFFGSPICAGGRLYCISKRGEVVVVSATADAFELLGRSELGEGSDATPAVANGRMYLRTLSHLMCLKGDAAGGNPAAVGRIEP